MFRIHFRLALMHHLVNALPSNTKHKIALVQCRSNVVPTSTTLYQYSSIHVILMFCVCWAILLRLAPPGEWYRWLGFLQIPVSGPEGVRGYFCVVDCACCWARCCTRHYVHMWEEGCVNQTIENLFTLSPLLRFLHKPLLWTVGLYVMTSL